MLPADGRDIFDRRKGDGERPDRPSARLAAVTDLEGESIRPARVEVLRKTPGTAVLAVTIHEGKNRQVRRMCAQCGLTVKRLRRVREGALELGDLPPGKWRYLTQDEAGALGVTP